MTDEAKPKRIKRIFLMCELVKGETLFMAMRRHPGDAASEYRARFFTDETSRDSWLKEQQELSAEPYALFTVMPGGE